MIVIKSKEEVVLASGITEETVIALVEGLGIVESSIELTMDRETGEGLICGMAAISDGVPIGQVDGLHQAIKMKDHKKVLKLLDV
jgi:hypothetical protein